MSLNMLDNYQYKEGCPSNSYYWLWRGTGRLPFSRREEGSWLGYKKRRSTRQHTQQPPDPRQWHPRCLVWGWGRTFSCQAHQKCRGRTLSRPEWTSCLVESQSYGSYWYQFIQHYSSLMLCSSEFAISLDWAHSHLQMCIQCNLLILRWFK